MILQTDIYTDILIKHNLTPEQFLFLWYVYREDINKGVEYAQHFSFDYDAIKDLEDRDYIISSKAKNEKYGFGNTVVNLEAIKNMIVENGYAAALEIWNNYPLFIMINGKKVYSRSTISKEAFMELYINHIDKNLILHTNILRITKELNEKFQYATMSIEKYISTEAYMAIEEELKNGRNLANDTFI